LSAKTAFVRQNLNANIKTKIVEGIVKKLNLLLPAASCCIKQTPAVSTQPTEGSYNGDP
jgi:hypothetical protein